MCGVLLVQRSFSEVWVLLFSLQLIIVKKYIFISALSVSILIQGFLLLKPAMADMSMWASEAKYVVENNPAEFNFMAAYGHPGGPIIEGVILIHYLSGVTYDNSLTIFILVMNVLLITGSCLLCYFLSLDNYWWPLALSCLSMNRLYAVGSTPPSTLAALLIVFLCLFSLLIYKKEKISTLSLIAWVILAGLTIATRSDIGVVMSAALFIFIRPKLDIRQVLYAFFGVVAAFVLFDPFMWFMPIRHLGDLIIKAVMHYEYFAPSRLGLLSIIGISSFSVVSMFLAAIFLYKRNEMESPVPKNFIIIMLVTTAILYTIFLTSQFQSARYFLPLVLIWETMLPLFIFNLISNIKSNSANIFKKLSFAILILYPTIFIIQELIIK